MERFTPELAGRRIPLFARLFSSNPAEAPAGLMWPRWVLLRLLGLITMAAFYSLLFQVRGIIGPRGILPAGEYLRQVAQQLGSQRLWFAPTLLWLHSSDGAVLAICWAGLIAGVALVCNLWPRLSVAVAFVCYLSFVAAAQDFSGYQSDGMLLEALFLSFFFAPAGLRPGLGTASPPSRASLFLLQWEWFRIYFESGMVKLLSGDVQWRHLTAMDLYYQNGPLPTWIGWYVAHLPHRFHAATALATLVMELLIVWMLFLPRRWRIACFCIVTPWEVGVIVTANYTFLNYLVLALGFLLLDDRFVANVWGRLRRANRAQSIQEQDAIPKLPVQVGGSGPTTSVFVTAAGAVFLSLILYATTLEMAEMPFGHLPLWQGPVVALDPFRIANRYGLFAVMTKGRYEIEFQGSNDGNTWTAYPFRYKPQALTQRPGIYAPYQPRLDWNLWFASLGDWQSYPIVGMTETSLLMNDSAVLRLFAGNPFAGRAPRYIRAVLYRYQFTSMAEKRATGDWWKRELLGVYAPEITRQPDAAVTIVRLPDALPEHD